MQPLRVKPIVIHYIGCRDKHVPRRALRSSLRLFVTCKRCQAKYWPSIVQLRTPRSAS